MRKDGQRAPRAIADIGSSVVAALVIGVVKCPLLLYLPRTDLQESASSLACSGSVRTNSGTVTVGAWLTRRGELRQEAPAKQIRITGPAGGYVVSVLDHESRAVVIEGAPPR